ncbi:MAG TPA: glycoside hydrolase family 43 protein [Chitinophagaceae bacterium]|nr:glycoside hydrolase family 43 protein [Chitinophagaceae bacterium]
MTLMIRLLSLLLVLQTTSCGKKGNSGTEPVPQPVEQTFTNPLLSSGPDPWILRKDSFYYYTHTLGNRISLWKTREVSLLRTVTPVPVWNAPATGPNVHNVWAPELHYLDGKWYLYYTAGATPDHSTQRLFVLENSSADPLSNNWVHKGQIRDPAADFFAIDGTAFTQGASRYFLWSGHATAADRTQRIYIARMSNPWTLESARVQLSAPDYAWESAGAPPAVNEGPQVLISPSGRLFIVYSASGCWTDQYALGWLRLKEGGDPMNATDWEKSANPVFTTNAAGQAYGPGHNSFFKSPDGKEDWILYHANPSPGLGCGDARSPRMQRITWNGDGTPNFGTPVPLGNRLPVPSGE